MKTSRGLCQLTSSIKLTAVFWERIPERLLLENGKGRRTGNQDTLQKKIGDHCIGAFFFFLLCWGRRPDDAGISL